MDPLWIVLIGTALMVFGVALLRVPAFLAMVVAGLVVSWLTPDSTIQWQTLRSSAVPIRSVEGATGGLGLGRQAVGSGSEERARVRVFERSAGEIRLVGEGRLERVSEVDPAGGGVEGGRWRLETWKSAEGRGYEVGHWVVGERAWKEARLRAGRNPIEVVAEGFGQTCRTIGLLILLASMVGQCLTDSGAAERIVRWFQERLGEARAPAAFAVSGFLVGVPVFFDTVFYLLMPLGRALALRTGRDFLLYTLTIVVGATMSHSLVPPTPGPLFAAGQFGVSMGRMMVCGAVVSLVAMIPGMAYAFWANRRWGSAVRVEYGGGGGRGVDGRHGGDSGAGEGGRLPPLPLAWLPIVVPIGLIALSAVVDAMGASASGVGVGWVRGASLWKEVVRVAGETTMALLAGCLAAVVVLGRQVGWARERLRGTLETGLQSGGVILLITAAGGAFGAALRQTDVAERLATLSGGGPYALLWAAFVVTASVRVAQGSATVAMITSAGLIAPVAMSVSLPYHAVYLALAVGCGSKLMPWMNDSGFWIVSRMSGMTEGQTLRTFSLMLTWMGLAGFGVVLLGARWLPMVP